jgi:hypothetical protein
MPGAKFAFACALLLSAGVARADDVPPASDESPSVTDVFEAHRTRGFDAVAVQNYRLGLREFLAAYAMKRSPDLLLAIADAHQKLGHGADAVAFYRRYIEAADVTDVERARIVGEIARIDRLIEESRAEPLPSAPSVGPGETLVPVRYEKRLDRGLFFSGIGLGIAGYLPSLIAGGVVGSQGICCNFDNRGHTMGLMLLIPVAGPFVSGAVSKDGTWAGAWILTAGVLQAIGVTLVAVGSRRMHEVPVVITPTANAGGAGLALGGTF